MTLAATTLEIIRLIVSMKKRLICNAPVKIELGAEEPAWLPARIPDDTSPTVGDERQA
jgi:hypothetical protein